jgi:murein DD-endopeptidase MepM/ murein hydrolase activator NlpD
MFRKRVFKIVSLSLILLPMMGISQIHERGMMRNRTNVAIESSEYTIGIIKDTNKFNNSFIQFVNNGMIDDIAAESEDDILYASFDTRSIHYTNRFDYSSITDPIPIELVNEENKQYYACPIEKKVTSRFGPRRRRWHYGVDLGLRTGDPIKVMFDGKVRIAKRSGAYGNLVVIRHDNGLETYYAHLSKINVKLNQEVKAGEILGLGGSTGRSTGPHLHLEIRYLGAAINPEKVIDFKTFSLISDTLMLTKDCFKTIKTPSSQRNSLAKNSSDSKSSKGGKYYKVRRGDTLGAIAKRHGTTVKKLAQLNNIKGTRITAGQTIKVR